MEALVVRGVGEVDFRWVQTDSYGVPPRDFLFYRAPRDLIKAVEFANGPAMLMPLSITRLPIHRLGGLPVLFAYWPENWLDNWGLKEVCKYFDIEVKEEDYGSSGYFVADPDDLGVQPVPGVALQRSEASSSAPYAISQGRPAIHPGHLLSDEGSSTA